METSLGYLAPGLTADVRERVQHAECAVKYMYIQL